ncbi:hypothetical protein Mal48_03850 [Thalassoglobus polymorphus]|uniref:Uncharacterized protein n=1 Tax=Thalassoglobus polymorphus TaxID=2527994 RepID=A0A517QHP1_9PLAN|nr:hypothetical protein Mal48_03850 [Thalassoglobus polymorphus]
MTAQNAAILLATSCVDQLCRATVNMLYWHLTGLRSIGHSTNNPTEYRQHRCKNDDH